MQSSVTITTFHAVTEAKDGSRLCLDQAPVGHVYGPDYWSVTLNGYGRGYKTLEEAKEAAKYAGYYGPDWELDRDTSVRYVKNVKVVQTTEFALEVFD